MAMYKYYSISFRKKKKTGTNKQRYLEDFPWKSLGNFAPIDSQIVGACLVVDPEDATQEIEGSWSLTVATDGNPEVATC